MNKSMKTNIPTTVEVITLKKGLPRKPIALPIVHRKIADNHEFFSRNVNSQTGSKTGHPV